MADFTVQFTSGVTYEPWLDPSSPHEPSRVNARAGQPLRRVMGRVGVPIIMSATVDNEVAPPDSALDGRLFWTFFIEGPTTHPGLLILSPGQSSVQRFTPPLPGHYTVRWRRPRGGLWHMHVDVEAP